MTVTAFIVVAASAVLALIALAVPAAKRLAVPLPVVVSAAGLSVGCLPLIFETDAASQFLDAYDAWILGQIALDSQALLLLFLPPLLFEMALAVNVRRLLDDALIVLVMAVVAVVLATGLIGLTVWAFSAFSLVLCLLIGAAISTTDPSAVVSTFKEIGAPRRLLVILEGESLLNDAAAIALFTLLIALAGAQTAVSPVGVVLAFLYDVGVGAGAGIAAAWAVSRIYPLLGASPVAETSMTVALAYGAYLLADVGLGASGVVAAVCAGLTTTVSGQVQMGPGNWRNVATVWAQIGFWANTLVLLIAAALAPALLVTLHGSHVLLLLAAFAGAFAARAAVLFGLLPGFSLLGLAQPMTGAQKTLAWWGGVRGAVTLLLAFSLADVTALPEADRTTAAAVACGFVFLTLLVNAASLSWLTRRLGLDRLSASDLALREKIVAGTLEEIRQHVDDLAAERAIDPQAVDDMRAVYEAQLHRTLAETQGVEIPFHKRLELGLAILCAQESQHFQDAFEAGAVGAAETRRLRATAERIGDAARTGGRDGYRRAMTAAIRVPRPLIAAALLQRAAGIDRPLRRQLGLRLTVLLETENALRDLERFVPTPLAQMIGEDAAANLGRLLAERRELVRAQIQAVSAQYPAFTERLETVLLLRAAARRERAQYDQLFAGGVIGAELHGWLVGELEDRRRALRRDLPELDPGLSARAVLDDVALLESLDEREKDRLVGYLKSRLVFPGETAAAPGRPVRGTRRAGSLYILAGGVAERTDDRAAFWLRPGDAVGVRTLLGLAEPAPAHVTAVSFCRVLVLTPRALQRLARRHPAIAQRLRAAARAQTFARSATRRPDARTPHPRPASDTQSRPAGKPAQTE
jgi:CPA1 family monovalent cation:H+ antiporter